MKLFALVFVVVALVLLVGCAAPTDAGPILESQNKPIPATAGEARIIGDGGRLPAADETKAPEPASGGPGQSGNVEPNQGP